MSVTGADKVLANLTALASKLPTQVGRAMFEEAEIEMAEAKRRTPVDTGALRASGHVELPKIAGQNVTVAMGFGGAAAPYAIEVHENLEAFHPVGEAKFLESTLNESKPYLAKRIADRVKLKEVVR
jgi:hypothetical protein